MNRIPGYTPPFLRSDFDVIVDIHMRDISSDAILDNLAQARERRDMDIAWQELMNDEEIASIVRNDEKAHDK